MSTAAWAAAVAAATAVSLTLPRRPSRTATAAGETSREGRSQPRPSRPLLPVVAGALAAAAAQWLLGGPVRPFWVVAGAVGVVVAQVVWRVRLARHERRATAAAVAECCETLAAELASGRTPVAALDSAASGWPRLREVAEAFHLGLDVPAAMRRLATRPGADELRLVAAAWEVGQDSGHGLAAALRRVSDTLQARRRTARVVESELASARATARMVALLPAVALLMGAGSGGDPLGFLVATTPGQLCAAAGLGLTVAGLGWIELLAERAAR